ncbi:MAG: hypothetical protein JF586_18150 [Burkholderiales bacterium]|nr:hypothetical protein [Burkholderiales bacterium]
MPLPRLLVSACLVALAAFGGCAQSYIVPGAKADLQAFAPVSIQEGFAAKPSAPFPAALALVRVQGPTYANFHLGTAGVPAGSRYSVVTTREVEDDAQFDRLGKLPQVDGVTGLNRMLLPEHPGSEKDLREAASRVHADLMLVYTFDTAFFNEDQSTPLTAISLGFLPTRKIAVSTTASALLVDTRTGYVYSTYESTKRSDTRASVWGSQDAADAARRDNERAAFGELVESVAGSWPKLLDRYARKA